MMQCAVANDCFKFDADHEFDVQSWCKVDSSSCGFVDT
jgi:hypothetical protein